MAPAKSAVYGSRKIGGLWKRYRFSRDSRKRGRFLMLFGVMSINLGELSHKMHIKLQKIW